MSDLANLYHAYRLANQFRNATFHLNEPVRLDTNGSVGGSAQILPRATFVRFLRATLDSNGTLLYHFEIIATHTPFSCESEAAALEMDLTPIWNGDRNPKGSP